MPSYEDFVRDYWAEDRDSVLAAKQREMQQSQPSVLGAPPPGFDSGKWYDQSHNTDKYKAGRYMTQNPNATIDQVLGILGGNYSKVSNDAIRDQDGNIIDLWKDFEGSHTPQWTMVGGGGNGNAGNPQGNAFGFGNMQNGGFAGNSNLGSILGMIGGGAGAGLRPTAPVQQQGSNGSVFNNQSSNQSVMGNNIMDKMPQMGMMFSNPFKKLRQEGATRPETNGALI